MLDVWHQDLSMTCCQDIIYKSKLLPSELSVKLHMYGIFLTYESGDEKQFLKYIPKFSVRVHIIASGF